MRQEQQPRKRERRSNRLRKLNLKFPFFFFKLILEESLKNQLTNFIFANLECWAAFRKTVERGVWWWRQCWPSFIFLDGMKVFGMKPRTNHYSDHNSVCSIWKCTHWRWETGDYALLATSNSVHHMWGFLPPVVTILITLISFTLWVRKGGRQPW